MVHIVHACSYLTNKHTILKKLKCGLGMFKQWFAIEQPNLPGILFRAWFSEYHKAGLR